jgi:hypothetical protein
MYTESNALQYRLRSNKFNLCLHITLCLIKFKFTFQRQISYSRKHLTCSHPTVTDFDESSPLTISPENFQQTKAIRGGDFMVLICRRRLFPAVPPNKQNPPKFENGLQNH